MKYAICVLTLLLTFLLVGCDSEAPAVAEPTVTEPVIFQTEPQETLPFSFTSEQFLKIDGYFDHTPMAECAPLADGVPYLQVSDPTNEVSVLQGGCTDGEYFYMAVEGSNLEIDGVTYKKAHKIYKIDCKTLETVAVSQILPLDHANSMCYNSKLDMLLVANCNDVITDDGLDNTKAVTYVNPDTLEIEDVVYLDFAINAIEYSPDHNLYVVGHKGSSAAFSVLDENFVELGYYAGHNLGLNPQDVGCTKDYIFVGNSGVAGASAGQEVVKVYDWDGEYKGIFRVGNVSEQEAIFEWDGVIYITFYNAPGGRIYVLDMDLSLLEQ